MIIQLDNVRRLFGPVKAVDNISFGFDRGTICGFIGPNGAGKTTTMRILATVDVPQAGEADICGYSVIDYPDRVRKKIGFMPDYFGTYNHMTVWEYLDFFGLTYGLHGKNRFDRVRRVMDFTDLKPLAQRDIAGLSKGMKQRLSLGRALINDPEVLILDEPAAGLDPRARIEVLELIQELASDGKALLVSSHILTELSKICDEVVIIDRGKISLTGTMSEIRHHLRSGRFKRDSAAEGDGATAKKVTITFSKPATDAEKLILEQPGVQEVRIIGTEAVVEHLGTQESLANLLKALVTADWPVVGFKSEQEGLEDVFMAVTEGGLE